MEDAAPAMTSSAGQKRWRKEGRKRKSATLQVVSVLSTVVVLAVQDRLCMVRGRLASLTGAVSDFQLCPGKFTACPGKC